MTEDERRRVIVSLARFETVSIVETDGVVRIRASNPKVSAGR